MLGRESLLIHPDTHVELQSHMDEVNIDTLKRTILDNMTANPRLPLTTWEELYTLLNGEKERSLIDAVRNLSPIDFGFAERVNIVDQPDVNFVSIEQSYTGADGQQRNPTSKYLPAEVFGAYTKMNEAYKSHLADSGINNRPGLIILSGYRSPAYQMMVFINSIASVGLEKTLSTVYIPGHSEHNDSMYTAVDFTCIGDENGNKPDPLNKGRAVFEDFREFQWLIDHMEEYGFVLTLFPDSEHPEKGLASDGFDYEPWHFRYLGDGAKRFMQENQVREILAARTKLMATA